MTDKVVEATAVQRIVIRDVLGCKVTWLAVDNEDAEPVVRSTTLRSNVMEVPRVEAAKALSEHPTVESLATYLAEQTGCRILQLVHWAPGLGPHGPLAESVGIVLVDETSLSGRDTAPA